MKRTIPPPTRWSPTVHLIITALILIVGVLFRKGFPQAGHWITVAALGYYLVANVRAFGASVRRFAGLPLREKAHLAIVVVVAVLFVRAFFIFTVSYFLVLVLLAVDYLLEAEEG